MHHPQQQQCPLVVHPILTEQSSKHLTAAHLKVRVYGTRWQLT
jgi:hypothetical protein